MTSCAIGIDVGGTATKVGVTGVSAGADSDVELPTPKGSPSPSGAREIVERLQEGDAVADQVFREAVDVLGGVLAVCCSLLGPVPVVIGGGLSCAGERLLAPLRACLDPSPERAVRGAQRPCTQPMTRGRLGTPPAQASRSCGSGSES